MLASHIEDDGFCHYLFLFFFAKISPLYFFRHINIEQKSHGRAELDAAGFIRAEENDKRTHIKKFVENFTFL